MSWPGSLPLVIRLARLVYRRAPEDVLGMRLKQYLALTTIAQTSKLTQRQLGEALHLDANLEALTAEERATLREFLARAVEGVPAAV